MPYIQNNNPIKFIGKKSKPTKTTPRKRDLKKVSVLDRNPSKKDVVFSGDLKIVGDPSSIENLKTDIPKTKSKSNKDIRLGLRNKRRTDRARRVDTDPLTGEYVKGSGAGGTDVGNFFRRFKNPAASQDAPIDGGNTGATNYDDKKIIAQNNKLNANYLSLMDKNPGYFQPKQKEDKEDLDHKSVGLSKKYKK